MTTQGNSMAESLMRSKIFGIFFVFWGVAFVFYGAAELANYFTTGWSSTPLLETILWVIVDVAFMLSGITLWLIATKILTKKS
jgi:hypothetical protein